LDFSGPIPSEFAPVESWARFIRRALKTGRTSLLANRLSRRQCEFAPEDLPAFGLQLLEELDASSLAGEDPEADVEGGSSDGFEEREWIVRLPDQQPTATEPPDEDTWLRRILTERLNPCGSAAPDDVSPDPTRDDQPGLPDSPPSQAHQRPHEAHARFHGDGDPRTDATRSASALSQDLDPDEPDVLERLEHLDDLVYDAIAGKPAAMDRLKAFWPQVRDHLRGELLAESQHQYLRHALSTWVESIEPDAVRNSAQAVQSLEVLCVLFDQI
jgi:hypothetical protein